MAATADEGRSNAESNGKFDPLDQRLAEATRSDSDQTLSDSDQTASDADQTGSDRDQASSDFDQRLADRDQVASNRDQATSDREASLGHDEDERTDAAREQSRIEREQTASERLRAGTYRELTTIERARAGVQRDRAAGTRDLLAEARDEAADARDRAIQNEQHRVGGRAIDAAAARATAADDRERARADRARAAEDRKQAARDRAQAIAELERASLDDLTGLYRRTRGMIALEAELERASRSGDRLTLAFVDIDGLKKVNDREGHAAGDAVIVATADALRAHLRPYDPIVRLGGDEFVCALTATAIDAAKARFVGIGAELAGSSSPSISVGLAELQTGDTLATLMRRGDADLLMKKRGRPGSPNSEGAPSVD